MSPASSNSTASRVLTWGLRAGGLVLMTAFLAVPLPTDTMAEIHRSIGLGEFHRGPLMEYLARSISALYGFHGILLLIVSTDLSRYRPILVYLGWTNLTFGAMLLAIDLHAGLPAWWTWSEGLPVAAIGAAILYLTRRLPTTEA